MTKFMRRYQLDGSTKERKRKIDCPYCGGKKCFTRYKDYETGEYLGDLVGMCDRGNKCGQHVKPKEYFSQYPEKKATFPSEQRLVNVIQKALVHIPANVLTSTLIDYDANSFIKPLTKIFPIHKIEKAISEYYLGTVIAGFRKEAENCKPAVLWFIDKNNNIRAGQVKLFDQYCRTAKYVTDEGEKRNYQTWMHTILSKKYKARGEVLPDWLRAYCEADKVTCLFGEHLLDKYPLKPVALVEAPKTAFIASIAYPEFVWLATSSLTYLTKERCKVLEGRRVVLFPDCGIPNSKTGKTCLQMWQERIHEFAGLSVFSFSTLLEDYATQQEKEQGLDLADLLLRDLSKPTLNISPKEILSIPIEVRTGKDFGNLVLATIWMRDGRKYDVLYDATTENLITSHPKIDALSAFFSKTFIPAKLDGMNCLIHIVNN